MNILIAEPQSSGHRLRYVGYLLPEAFGRGHTVTLVTTPDAIRSDAYAEFIAPHHGAGLVVKLLSYKTRQRVPIPGYDQYRRYRWFKKAICELSGKPDIDLVLIPYLGYIDKLAAILGPPFGGRRWGGIVMNESFHHATLALRPKPPILATLRERLFFRLVNNSALVSLMTLDDTLFEYVRGRGPTCAKLSSVVDPADLPEKVDRVVACNDLGLSERCFNLLVYGAIDHRKGIKQLLDAFFNNHDMPSSLCIIVAGACDAPTRGMLMRAIESERGKQVKVFDRFITVEEEKRLFSASDAVWIGYVEHYGSSGVVQQAAAAGLPIVACKVGLIGRTVEEHKLGLVVDIEDRKAVCKAIKVLASDANARKEFSAAGKAYSTQRTPTCFRQQVFNSLEARMNGQSRQNVKQGSLVDA